MTKKEKEGGLSFEVIETFKKIKFKDKDNYYVYIVKCCKTGMLKVGVTKRPKQRLAVLQTGYPFKLKLIYLFKGAGTDFEKFCHNYLSDYKIKGEWFSVNARHKIRQIENICYCYNWFEELVHEKVIDRMINLDGIRFQRLRDEYYEKQIGEML